MLVVKGLVYISVSKSNKTYGEIINCGSNYEISIGDMVKLVAEIMDVEIDIISDEVRLRPDKSEVERLWCDASKLESLTGYKPSISLQDGLRKTIEWFSKHENLSQYKVDIYNV